MKYPWLVSKTPNVDRCSPFMIPGSPDVPWNDVMFLSKGMVILPQRWGTTHWYFFQNSIIPFCWISISGTPKSSIFRGVINHPILLDGTDGSQNGGASLLSHSRVPRDRLLLPGLRVPFLLAGWHGDDMVVGCSCRNKMEQVGIYLDKYWDVGP